MASHGKEASAAPRQRRAAGKASGIDGTVRVKLLECGVDYLCGRYMAATPPELYSDHLLFFHRLFFPFLVMIAAG
ncbi:hypothetical protein D3871_12025 [Noviherbaspirillum saxi]|uniref:Uncharacterized protein n=1 Tax=Noviherbaspirillum saxi TaxID=2320863 RepID=A0A3A3FY83_9BURK|nr:hypothetical protein D3871_12025 [Noviherbaspirillum saxi]